MASEESQVQAIFFAALEKESAEGRAAYLDEVCGPDHDLRERVEALLQAQTKLGNFLQPPAVAVSLEKPGSRIGPYQLLEPIGEGGFGVVYLAEQMETVKRRVALKIIKPGMDTKEVIARFEAERQALALMDHPHIARVLDGGTTDSGRPFFVMELVKGVPITEYCDQCNLTTRERLQLFFQVCRAVQHAHQKGVIHRDLKPSNVMIAMQDGRPAPKIIDFGVAKAINQRLTEHTLVTAFSQVLGTPLYMSPEQAELSPLDVDTRSDIYSLGVLLYELLTSTTPVEKERAKEASYDELRRMIREEEPPRPSARISTLGETAVTVAERHRTDVRRLRQAVRGDLDWIVMKALEKDRVRRYDTASALAEDVVRHLNDEPIEARPPSAWYKFQKFGHRNRAALLTAVLILVTVLLGLAISTVLIAQERNVARAEAVRASIAATREAEAADQARTAANEARREREQALQVRNLALENLYFAHVQLAHHDWDGGHVGRMHDIIDAHVPRPGEPDLRGWEWYYLSSLCHRELRTLRGHTSGVASISESPDGEYLASASLDRTVRVWDLKTGNEIAVLRGHKSDVLSVSWRPDGEWLASGDSDGKVVLWDANNYARQKVLEHEHPIRALAWSSDGQRLVAGGVVTEIHFPGSGAVENPRGIPEVASRVPLADGGEFQSVAWSPDGRYICRAGGWPGWITICDGQNGTKISTFRQHSHTVCSVAWSPDGQYFASASVDHSIMLWEAGTWTTVRIIPSAHRGIVLSLAWSTDGTQLVSAGEDGLVKIWDVSSGQERKSLRGHEGAVQSVSWRGETVISASADGTIKQWDLAVEPDAHTIAGRNRIAWSPDSQLVAAQGLLREGPVRAIDVFDGATGRKLFELRYEGTNASHTIDWSPDGRKLAVALMRVPDPSSKGKVIVWDVSTRQPILDVFTHGQEARCVSWSPDGHLLASAGADGLVHLWNVESGEMEFTFSEHTQPLGSAVWKPDGTQIASATWQDEVKIWEPATGRVVHDLRRPNWLADGHYSICWSPNGDQLAAGCSTGEIIVWDAASGREILRFSGHTSHVRAVAWSPDGARLASGGYDCYVKIWDAIRGRELLSLSGHRTNVDSISWSPNGTQLATAGGAAARIWDASVGYELAREMEHP